MNAMEVGKRVVTEGLRLPLPNTTPPILMRMIQSCWEEVPEQRPTFRQIIEDLKKF